MTSKLSSSADLDFVAQFSQAASAFRESAPMRPSADAMVEALLAGERAAKQQRLSYPVDTLWGDWRLCFATGTRKLRQRGGIALGKGFYLPKLAIATLSFQPLSAVEASTAATMNLGTICNQARVRSLAMTFTGPCRYEGKKNLLAFDFTELEFSAFGRSLYRGQIGSKNQQPFTERRIAKMPFFAFFCITDDFIAARGRGGGLALWVRDR
jgi:hypothetical protein